MATSTVASAGAGRMMMLLLLGLVLASVVSAIPNDVALVFPMDNVPLSEQNSAMMLQMTAPEGEAVPLTYTVVPLTTSVGLNLSERTRNAVWIRGTMVSATPDTYINVSGSDTIAYLCCDNLAQSFITPSMIISALMTTNKPKAILLYSMKGNCCGLQGSNLPYQTVFSMADAAEAVDMLNVTNFADGIVQATITGNVTSAQQEDQDQQDGSNSAVAMSILYSITGLITLLFLIIIATGAIRAHRYPERYGPRSGYGGRTRQSRAKGIARAVLETLPIVKFGAAQQPAKPDPALELEASPPIQPVQDYNMGTRLSAIPEEPTRQSVVQGPPPSTGPNVLPTLDERQESSLDEDHLGCSICTEDFTVGEDVRVLPCDHKFHPPCIDPWLINVSGTCPLCRLDLNPQNSGTGNRDMMHLPPPLDAEVSENDVPNTQRRRSSRFLDLNRLRHASVEERIEILRRHRSHQQESSSSTVDHDGSEHAHKAKVTDRLRDKFRVRTRQQSPARPRASDD